MSDENNTVENEDDFDAAYEEFASSDLDSEDQTSDDSQDDDISAEVETDDSQSEEDPAPEEQQDSGDASGNATEAEGQEGASSEPEAQPEETPEEEVTKLQQKLKSAEGRLNKFEESVEDMREQLKKYEKPEASEDEPESTGDTDKSETDDSEFIPPGMDKDDWLDLQEDYPDTAKALKEKFQNETDLSSENKALKEKQEQLETEQEARAQFRKTILDVHSDYDSVIAPKLDDLQAFIKEQSSAVLQQSYQRIFETGTADEVNALVTDYKAARGLSKETTDSDPPESTATPDKKPNKKLDDALAVPSRGGGNRVQLKVYPSYINDIC